MTKLAEERSGARFFDGSSRDRGWASKVTQRPPRIAGLTVLDIVEPEPGLAAFLGALDQEKLVVQYTGTTGESVTFRWASGYENGNSIRIQGMLEQD